MDMLQLFLRSIAIYGALILLFRLMGKRQLGDLELSELLVTVLISQVASTPLVDSEKPLWTGIIPVVALLGTELILSLISLKNVRFRAILSGKPALLIVRGKIDQSQMRRNRFTPDELAEALRNEGILDLNSVDYAILETDGKLNVIPAPAFRPVTAGQMGLSEEDTGYPMLVINNGRVLVQNLHILGKDEKWLEKALRAQGLNSPKEVYLMTTNPAGDIFIAPKEN